MCRTTLGLSPITQYSEWELQMISDSCSFLSVTQKTQVLEPQVCLENIPVCLGM